MIKLLFTTLVMLLCFAGGAQAIDLWGPLKKVFEKSPKPSDPQLDPAVRALTGFSEEEEVAIGRQAAGNLLGAAPLVNDQSSNDTSTTSGAGSRAAASERT